jgi:hypothetical protein
MGNFFADPEVIISKNGLELKNYPQHQNNEKMIFIAISNNEKAIQYISKNLSNNEEFLFQVVKQNFNCFKFLPENQKLNLEFVKKCLKINSHIHQFLPLEIQNRPDVRAQYILSSYKFDRVLGLMTDDDLIIEIVKLNPVYYRHLSVKLQLNRKIALESLKRSGYLLTFAPKEFKNDKEIVLVAVESCGCALSEASELMKSDFEVVLCAVKNDGCAINYASEHIKNDKKMIVKATKRRSCSSDIFSTFPKYWKEDKEIEWISKQYCELPRNLKTFHDINFSFINDLDDKFSLF